MQKFKELTAKRKVEHIWYYYKWYIIISIFVIAFIVNLLQTISQKDESIPLLTISLQGFPTDYERIAAWEEDITDKIAGGGTEQKVRADYYPINLEKQDQASVAYTQKFVVLLSAGELDIVYINEDLFETQALAGYYKPLDMMPELSSILSNNEARIVKRKKEGDINEHIYGIRAEDIKIFEDLEEDTKGKIVAIASTTERLSKSIDFIKLILE